MTVERCQETIRQVLTCDPVVVCIEAISGMARMPSLSFLLAREVRAVSVGVATLRAPSKHGQS